MLRKTPTSHFEPKSCEKREAWDGTTSLQRGSGVRRGETTLLAHNGEFMTSGDGPHVEVNFTFIKERLTVIGKQSTENENDSFLSVQHCLK